jgi:hypothetical protein
MIIDIQAAKDNAADVETRAVRDASATTGVVGAGANGLVDENKR